MSDVYKYAFETIIGHDINSERKINIIKECIETGIDININESFAIMDATDIGDTKTMQFLIDNGIDVNGYTYKPALSVACKDNNLPHVQMLLYAGANVNAIDAFGESAILQTTNIDIIKLLVEHGADPFVNNNRLLMTACEKINIPLIDYLVSIGMDLFFDNNKLLFNACHKSDYNIIKYLIDHGADIKNPDNRAIIEIFNSRGYFRCKKLLLENGADPNFTIDIMHSLEFCIINASIDECKLLFDYGADTNMCINIINQNYSIIPKNKKSRGSINRDKELIRMFMEHGLDITEFINKL